MLRWHPHAGGMHGAPPWRRLTSSRAELINTHSDNVYRLALHHSVLDVNGAPLEASQGLKGESMLRGQTKTQE